MSIRERGGHDSLVKNIVTRQLPITYSPGRPSGLCTNEVGRPRSPTGRSGKTNGIVIEAKMRAGRRRKLFRQETGWRETVYAGVSVISMTSAKTFADEKQIC